METIVQAILALAVLKYALKTNAAPKRWQRLYFAAQAGLWALACTPVVIEQPTNTMALLLGNRTAVINGAAIVCLECMAGLSLGIALLSAHRPKRWVQIMHTLPNPLMLLAIPYFEMQLFSQNAGLSFVYTSLIFSILTTITIILFGWMLKRKVRTHTRAIELELLLNAAMLVGSLLISSAAAHHSISSAQVDNTAPALLAMLCLSALLFGIGLMLPKARTWATNRLRISRK